MKHKPYYICNSWYYLSEFITVRNKLATHNVTSEDDFNLFIDVHVNNWFKIKDIKNLEFFNL